MKVLIVLHHRFDLWNAPAWFAERLRRDFTQLQVVHLHDYDQVDREITDAEVAVAWSLRPDQIQHARKLRWIHSPAAAVHQLMFPELINSEVVLTNAREVHGPVVAEHVIALVFALAKCLPQSARLQQKHVWGQEILWNARPRPREVSGATIGLVGLGSIGREVAHLAHALGMRVIAVREHPGKETPPGVQQIFPSAQLDAMLSQSDYAVLAAPVTPATSGLMNADRLAAMKSEACLINVGRGPLLDHAALADSLRSHRIGGAALDVFDKEPLPSDSPLWDVENLFITPHTAGLTDKLWERHYTLFSENLRRYLAGQTLLAIVDKQTGY